MTKITERGMIFNAEMVRALLAGRKTQTRRPVGLPVHDKTLGCELAGNELAGELAAGNYLNSAFGKPGHRIWVRETWTPESIDAEDGSYSPDYRATANGQPLDGRWTPAIHMPRWASRITLEITDVRVERLNSISESDAIAEGLERYNDDGIIYYGPFGRGDCRPEVAYRDLWLSIYGAESWQANPWVWVIEFKRVEGGAA
ncbi:hypothetical protein M2416_001633 [Raoultella sp. BIGb0132]|jgi:hypothetical protein|nr:morphogenetic protein [Raoultella terrigena]MCS4271163.1 hypothetical protein [Raoultella sp. BIGb0132]MCS4288528.1 hypothetical protein [Raoultella terrigena]